MGSSHGLQVSLTRGYRGVCVWRGEQFWFPVSDPFPAFVLCYGDSGTVTFRLRSSASTVDGSLFEVTRTANCTQGVMVAFSNFFRRCQTVVDLVVRIIITVRSLVPRVLACVTSVRFATTLVSLCTTATRMAKNRNSGFYIAGLGRKN